MNTAPNLAAPNQQARSMILRQSPETGPDALERQRQRLIERTRKNDKENPQLNQGKAMQKMIDNYINGNLATAREQAKRLTAWKIRDALQDYAGYSLNKATLTADWLKGRDCFQAACDAA